MGQYAIWIRWASLSVVVLSVLLWMRVLPVGAVMRSLQEWLEGLGPWGPLVFALIYVAAVAMLLPAWPLTVTSSALFGFVVAFILCSLASTAGVALTFLISRYLARDQVARRIRKYPKFAAIDRAISEGGWKIVALLRLSPAIPFNVQNYLYGLTGIGFWTCVVTSWVAMLPGTFLYVYLGHVGRAGIEAASGDERSRTPAEWAMTIVGLVATVAVTVYVTRLAKNALHDRSDLAPEAEDSNLGSAESKNSAQRATYAWSTVLFAFVAIALLALSIWAQFNPDWTRNMFSSVAR